MKLRFLLLCLCLGLTTAVGYADKPVGALPFDGDANDPNSLVFKNPNILPGGNVIDSNSVVVPEPSATALVGLGFLGFATLRKLRGRRSS